MVIIMAKAKDAVCGFVSHSRRDRTEFTFDWLMNVKKEAETAQ